MSLKISNHNIILGIILLVAAFLRFFHFWELPFMWDELSALHRLRFDSFSDLIKNGVKPDGHPAGVQVFLYYWIHLFGNKEWVVKLPFNLMGLASVWLIYKITKIWFTKESGLIAAAYATSLQFFVLYSPISRPYVSGLFLTLMMVFYWSKYMFSTPKRTYLFGFIAFAALSAYNHHFSLLFAAIVGFSGLFFIPKNLLKEYMISGVVIFLLYTPHLPIFFHQLGVGGIGGEGLWLAKPDWSFISDFFLWAFHFSLLNLFIVIAFGFTTIVICIKHCFYQKISKIGLLFGWFSLPLIIGLLYSIYINPVIQYSMLLFSFPYFIIFISIWASKISRPIIYVMATSIVILNSYQLIENRKHYEIITKQPFNTTAKLSAEQKTKTFIVFNTIPEYQEYYFNKYELNNQRSFSIYDKEISAVQLDSILSNRKEEILIVCGLEATFENIARRNYPYLIKRENAYTMDCYVFSKNLKHGNSLFSKEIEQTNFSSISPKWKLNSNNIKRDSSNNYSYQMLPDNKWGPNFEDSLSLYPKNAIIDIHARIRTNTPQKSPLWVSSTHKNKEQLYWRGQQTDLLKSEEPNIYDSYYSIDTRLLNIEQLSDSLLLKTYLWNKNSNEMDIMSISYSFREPSPIKYSLFGKNP